MNDQPAEYRRTDPSKEPRTPAGQAAAVEGMLAAHGLTPADRPEVADHNRRRAALLADTSTASARMRAQMLEIMSDFEAARRAEIIAAGGDPDDDLDPLEQVRNIADDYTRHADRPDALDDLLDLLADEVLTLDDIRALRIAGEAAVAATPRAIKAARGRGMKPPQIAAELGLTPSRVYQVLREQAAAETAPAPPVDEYRLSTRNGDQ